MSDTRNWKCFFGLHQFDSTIKTGTYRRGGEYYTNESGVFYTKVCSHCGLVRNFHAAEKLEDV